MNWPLLQNSFVVASASACLALLLGGMFALFGAAVGPKTRGLAIIAAIVALVLPPFLVTNTWLQYFGLTGTWRSIVNFDLYSLPGTVLLITLSLWPVPFFLILGTLLRIQPVYLEQEPLLRGLALARYLLWPTCRGAVAAAFSLSFVLALNNFSVPVLLQTKVYTEEVWLAFSTRFDYATALKFSWPLVLGPLLLLAMIRIQRSQFVFRTTHFPSPLFRARIGFAFPVVTVAAVVVLATSVLLPFFQLAASSRTWTEFLPAIAAGKNAALNSLIFAGGAALVVAVLAHFARSTPHAFWMWIFFLTPGVLLGISMIWIFNRPPLTAFYQSAGIVLFAYLLRFFALGWTGARLASANSDSSLREVIVLAGGNRWDQFRLGEWPQSRNLLLASAYLLFLLCLWEVETLLLIVPPGRETLALRIFNMLHYGHAGQVDALCVWLLIFALVPLLAFAVGSKLKSWVRPTAALVIFIGATGCAPVAENQSEIRSKLFSSVQIIGSRGTGAGQFNKPRSVAVDKQDNLYVVDLTGRVQKFSPEGNYLLSWQMPETDKGKAKGMIKDCEGNIVVVEPHYSRVNHFDAQGKLLAQWGVNGTNESKLQFPRAVAVNSRGEMYLSEYGLVERIQRFSHRGTNFIKAFGTPGTSNAHLNRAEGLGIGPDDRVYVADSCNHRIQVFSAEGKFLSTFGRAGSGAGEMSYPYDVRIDPAGTRFVCEFGNSRIQIFDSEGRTLEILGGAGIEPGQFHNPWAIALDSRGNLYVADSSNHRVQKFTRRDPIRVANAGSKTLRRESPTDIGT